MRLGIDLDDVLADLIGGLIELHRDLTGTQLTRDQALNWDVFPPEVHQQMRTAGYGRLLPISGAREFLAKVREEGHAVFIITYRGPDAEAVSRHWLDTHFAGLYDDLICTGGGKVAACRTLGIDLLVDDSLNQVPAVTRALGIPGILITTPMNRAFKASGLIRRADDLETAALQVAQTEAWLRDRTKTMKVGAVGSPDRESTFIVQN